YMCRLRLYMSRLRLYNRSKMPNEVRRGARFSVLLLFMCAVVCAQAASLTFEHSHQNSTQHCCGLCHTGPLPILGPVTSVTLTPMVAVAWLPSASHLGALREVLSSTGCSRAPPA